ncbi:transposase, partial [Escherichia coli]
ELQKRGLKFSGKTVRKLMQQLGLKSPVRLKKYRSYRGNMGLAPTVKINSSPLNE